MTDDATTFITGVEEQGAALAEAGVVNKVALRKPHEAQQVGFHCKLQQGLQVQQGFEWGSQKHE